MTNVRVCGQATSESTEQQSFIPFSFPSEEEHVKPQRDRSPDSATRHPEPSRLGAVVLRDPDERRSQLRGSSGISPLSRASRCRFPEAYSFGLQRTERLPRVSSGILLSSQRLQLRGSGGISPRFPTPDGVIYTRESPGRS